MNILITYPDQTPKAEFPYPEALAAAKKWSEKSLQQLCDAGKLDISAVSKAFAAKKPLSKPDFAAFAKAAGVKFTLKPVNVAPIKIVLPENAQK